MDERYMFSEEEIDAILKSEKHSDEWLEKNARFTDHITSYEDIVPVDGE